MKITLLGASGRTGLEVMRQALANGHTVTAIVRNTRSLIPLEGLTIVQADVTNTEDLAGAVKECDVVISTLGATGGTLMTDAITALIKANEITPVKRFVLLSSFLACKDQLSKPTKLLASTVMSVIVKDKLQSEEILKKSKLAWTIVSPTILTTARAGARVRVVPKTEKVGLFDTIARGDVARWMLEEITANKYANQTALITKS